MFGLLNLYATNVKARHEFTEFVGATMFGTYNVISLVVLLNMLIAMMNNSYQLIAVSYLICSLFCFYFSPCASSAWLIASVYLLGGWRLLPPVFDSR